jgi:hypothetical protein
MAGLDPRFNEPPPFLWEIGPTRIPQLPSNGARTGCKENPLPHSRAVTAGKIKAMACDRVLLKRRSLWPGEDSRSSPGPELLGANTSHGPSRESYTPFGKASGGQANTSAPPAASAPPLSTEGMRTAVSAAACAPAVLQRGVPEGRTGVVGVEGPVGLAGIRKGQAEAERAKPTLPPARQRAKTARERGGSGDHEGHH